jgi:hypothetical protein
MGGLPRSRDAVVAEKEGGWVMKAQITGLKPTVYIDAVPALVTRREIVRRGHHISPRQRRIGAAILVVIMVGLASLLSACGKKVMVPPRVDLAEHPTVGVIAFSIEDGDTVLAQMATERFTQHLLDSYRGLEVFELGDTDELLGEAGRRRLDDRAARDIGDEYGVDAIFVGRLQVSDIKPAVSLLGIANPQVRAKVSVSLSVRMIDTQAGATTWRNSIRQEADVASLALIQGHVSGGAGDPNEAYRDLVESLVWEVTRDFYPTFERR